MSTKLPPNTHSDEELESPEFRAGVERMKNAIRIAVVRIGLADERLDNIATVWIAVQEFAKQLLLSDKGKVQAEAYWTKLLEFAEWQFEHEGHPQTEGQKQVSSRRHRENSGRRQNGRAEEGRRNGLQAPLNHRRRSLGGIHRPARGRRGATLMSIHHFIYVTPEPKAPLGRVYNRVIVRELIEDVNRKGGKDHGQHTVFIQQAGVAYLYEYQDPTHARDDFETWRAEPCERITLKLAGVVQPEGRLPLTKEQIEKWKATKAKEEESEPWNFGAEEHDD